MLNATTATSSTTGSVAQSTENTTLDRDAFLKLLITEMKSQDPMNPMDDKEFIAQLAQFSSLEQMQSMNQSMGTFVQSQSAFEALSLIGRTVKWNDPDTSTEMTGKVESVQFKDGSPILEVGGNEVPLGYLTDVS